jgi:hypothetical protein
VVTARALLGDAVVKLLFTRGVDVVSVSRPAVGRPQGMALTAPVSGSSG